MKLFDESENKYYEMLSYLLTGQQSAGVSDLYSVTNQYISGEIDFDVIDSLFPRSEVEEVIFRCVAGGFVPVLDKKFPVLTNHVEKQALKNLLRDEYKVLFLTEDTQNKLRKVTETLPDEWDEHDIDIKNRFAGGVAARIENYQQKVSFIAKAIHEKKAIVYDNIKEGEYEFRDTTAVPVRLEYSTINDRFRLYVYLPKEEKFVKMNLDTMSNIRETRWSSDKDISAEFIAFCKQFGRTVILDVEPLDYVIERCFRVFSCYDRKARYDKEENKYILQIEYLSFDEAEVIRDILSFGSRVVVTGPEKLRNEVYRRILAARDGYME